MLRLPLYDSLPRAVLETTPGREIDPTCTRCELHGRARSVCLGADGEPGGLLVVGESPGRNEDAAGRPFLGESGGLVRMLVKRHWRGGPVVLDNAVRCAPGQTELKEKHLTACRPYLAQTLREARPTRVVTLGGWAARAVLGRSVSPFTTRRGYAFLTGVPGRIVPVMMVLHPTSALRNRFVRQWFEADMAWALTASPPRPPWDADVHVVETPDDAQHAVAELRRAPWAMFDVETAGLLFDPSFRLLSVALCAKGERDAWVWGAEALADPATARPLFDYLADPRATKGGTNVKFDMLAAYCQTRGVMPRGVRIDVRLWRKLLEPEADGKLERMAELIGMGGMKEENAEHVEAGKGAVARVLGYEKRVAKHADKLLAVGAGVKPPKPPKAPEGPQTLAELGIDPALERVVRNDAYDKDTWAYALVPRDVLYRYNARDAVATTALAELLEPELRARAPLARVWDTIVERASRAVAQVEAWGVASNRDAILALDQYLEVREADLLGKLNGYAKLENWNSRDQIADLLFNRLKLPSVKLTDAGEESTANDVLETLKHRHPLIEHLIDYRSVTKLRGTYARGLLPHVRADGRIHPTLLLDGARTGRWSCQHPNLQNQPRAKTAEAKMVRDSFVAAPGHQLVEFDYSQIEIRVAAMLSRDPVMIEILASGADFHQRTAELISKIAWGIEPSQVTDEHRSLAKAVNFGILYGKTANTFASEWGVPKAKAQAVIDAIFGRFQRLATWMREQLAEARRTGEVWTWWAGQRARRRPLWCVADVDEYARSVAEHGAVNTPVQGTANEFCVASLVEAIDWIEGDAVPAKLVLAVHDSMLFEVREDAVGEVLHMVPRIMLSHDTGGVPFKADAKTGRAWGSLEKWKGAAATSAAA